ncbi:hypothetical protein [Actinomycetospora atypica]|uniref:Uncharacterized protein n=1 Tax=Actinomycetospora atypica TaxID=1290095 RepID=A0ABV9YUC6_9PSEU
MRALEVRTLRRLWSLRETVALESGDDRLTMIAPWGEIDLGRRATRVEPDLRRLALGPVDLDNAEPDRRAELAEVLDGVTGAVAHSLEQAGLGQARLSVVPIAAEAPFRPVPADPRSVVRLSRLTVIRPSAGSLVVSAPGARHEVVCEGPVLGALLSKIASSVRVAALSGRATDGGPDGDPCLDGATCQDVEDVLGWLIATGVVQVGREDGTYDEDVDPDLVGWTPLELEFEARTRRPGQVATERLQLRDRVATMGAVREPYPGTSVPLPTVGGRNSRMDQVLAPAYELPTFTGGVLTAARLGALLSRGLRMRAPDDRRAPEVGPPQRPYLSVGRLCELEIYVALDRAELDTDVYHYDPAEHALTSLGLPRPTVTDIVAACSSEIGEQEFAPAAVLLATSRRAGSAGTPGTATHATALVQAGALQQILLLVGRENEVTVYPAPLVATEGWQAVIDRVWPAEVPVAVCALDPAR